MLNDTDFVSLAQEKQGRYRITKEQFASLKPDGEVRLRICDTRKILRLVRAKKVTEDDFVDNYKWWLPPVYLTAPERKEILDAQIDTAANNWR